MMRKLICLIIFLLPVLLGFSQRAKKDTTVVDTLRPAAFKVSGKPVNGNASIYDLDFDGSKTASGETFFNIRLTAASNDFDLNSWVKVTNPKNKKYTIVRINDKLSSRQKKNGVRLNLSHEAGKELGIKKEQLFKVKIELISINDSSIISDKSFTAKLIDTLPSSDTTPNTFKPYGKPVNGIASFYSYNLDGTITATGERYRNALLTAASNNFKLNTWVLVTNLKNKKSVIVRINDRMHPRMKKKGRVVDLSREAARLLEFMDNGLAKVKVQPIKFVFSPEVKEQLDSAKAAGDSSKPIPDSTTAPDEKEDGSVTGIASFYSKNLDGTETATGERYRNAKLSAASNNFDLNTWVRVTNLRNNKSVILRINDRMHPRMKAKGRVVDLSRIAAAKLDFMKSGLTRVKVEPVEKGTVN